MAWQSDIVADLIETFRFPYIALNPGASYRGLHDSLVDHNHNEPPLLLCQHEKIAAQIAHGYAKASGEPMVAIVHDVVGLLHALCVRRKQRRSLTKPPRVKRLSSLCLLPSVPSRKAPSLGSKGCGAS